MKCKKCSERASIKMPQHNMALCHEHFLEWLPQHTQRTIEKFRMFTPDEKVIVAVSGGKDSLALWDVLIRLGYQADGIYIDLGAISIRSNKPLPINKFLIDIVSGNLVYNYCLCLFSHNSPY